MKSILISCLAGACYSAAYVSPKPFWVVFLVCSTVLVGYMRAFN